MLIETYCDWCQESNTYDMDDEIPMRCHCGGELEVHEVTFDDDIEIRTRYQEDD